MAKSIPADAIVRVVPSVISAGGRAMDLNGLALTDSARIPIGAVYSFPSTLAVANHFGPTSNEAVLAASYFLGFTNSNQTPGALLMAQYNSVSVVAYLKSGDLQGMSLAMLQAIKGVLTISVNGVPHTTALIDLAGVTSFSNAAGFIATALATVAPGQTVVYDQVWNAFVISTGLTGALASIGYASGTLAPLLSMTQATGAVLSQGADPADTTAMMNSIIGVTTNWASFTTTFLPVQVVMIGFAAWANGRNNRFLYVPFDQDVTATQIGAAAQGSFGQKVLAAGYNGIAIIYQDPAVAFFLMGAVASLDFSEHNGRATMAFRNQTGLVPSVTDQTAANNLIANGYNFYGSYATANQAFTFLYPGQVTGPFAWIDSYVDEIWLGNQFQLALMVLMTQVKSLPYNDEGYTLVRAACSDVVVQALNFGVIRAGVTLSNLQVAEVNGAAGFRIDDVLQSQGSYLQIKDASPQVRQARGSPPCTFWYMDGQSIQQISLASVQVQ